MSAHLHLAVVEVGRAWFVLGVLLGLAELPVQPFQAFRLDISGLADRVAAQPEYLSVVARQSRSSARLWRLLQRHTGGHTQPVRNLSGGWSKMQRPSRRSWSKSLAPAKRHCDRSTSVTERLEASAPRSEDRTGIHESSEPRCSFGIWLTTAASSSNAESASANCWSAPATNEGSVSVTRSRSTLASRRRIVTPASHLVSVHVTETAAASTTTGQTNTAP